jgi:hypothetical protein
MKYLSYFNESKSSMPTVEDAKRVFESMIQDFADSQKLDLKFNVKFNIWLGYPDEDEDIKWVNFKIKSESKFNSEYIYPLVERLFNWSKSNGAKLSEIHLVDSGKGTKVIKIYKENKDWFLTDVIPALIRNPIHHPQNYMRYVYETTFQWVD